MLDERGIPYPMLSDPAGKIGTLYGVYDEAEGVNVRGRFIIDPNGVLQSVEILPPGVGRSVNELLRQLSALQYHAETGEVTPVDWEPDEPTLRPALDLSGKVGEVWKPK